MSASADSSELDDQRVFAALQEYQAEVASGRRPDRAAFLARHEPIASALAECLDALAFVGAASPPAARADLAPGAVLGGYRLLREIGRGGMGVVFEAEHLAMARRVALKVLPHVGGLDARQVRRFRNEIQAAAGLDHPNVTPVYEADCVDGVHFFSMQLIDGFTLSQLIGQFRRSRDAASTHAATSSPTLDRTADYSPSSDGDAADAPPAAALSLPGGQAFGTSEYYREVARLIEEPARALHHAHQSGVVHRDVKPGNLMLDRRGRVWVTDFGLAKLPGSELTATGDVLGTLRYASPEQASGRSVGVDHRTDVYSLGATLYEMLTLTPAFPGDDRLDVLQRILGSEPTPPRKLQPSVPAELEVIALKALARDPNERYASAEEMADDLRRFLGDLPIQARPPGLGVRLRKWARRNWAILWSAAIALGLFLASSVVVLALSNARISAETKEKGEALVAKGEALVAEQKATRDALDANERSKYTRYVHAIALAHREWLAGNPARVRHLLDGCPEKFRGWEWRYLDRLLEGPLIRLSGQGRSFVDVKYSPDGSRIATVSDRGDVQFWDAETGHEKGRLKLASAALRLVYHPDGKSVALAYRTRELSEELFVFGPNPLPPETPSVRVSHVEIATGRLLRDFLGHTRPVTQLAFSPDGRRLASVSHSVHLLVWDAENGQEVWKGNGSLPAFSPDGKLVGVNRGVKTLLLDAADGKVVRELEHPLGAGAFAFNPDGKQMAVSTASGFVLGWDLASGKQVFLRPTLTARAGALAFSPDGLRLAIAGGRTVRILGAYNRTLRGPAANITGIAFHPDGIRVAVAAEDGTVHVWHLLDPTEFRQVRTSRVTQGVQYAGHTLAFDSRGQRLARGRTAGVAHLNLRTEEVSLLPTVRLAHLNPPFLTFPCADDVLTLVSGAGAIGRYSPRNAWDVTPAEVVKKTVDTPISESFLVVEQVAFDEAGELVAFLAGDGRFCLRETRTGAVRFRLDEKHDAALPHAVTLDKGGTRLAVVGHEEGTLKVYDVANKRELLRLASPVARVVTMRYSPDGTALLLAGEGGEMALLDEGGRVRRKWGVPRQGRMPVAFSPDGSRLALGLSRDAASSGGVLLWELRTGEELLTLSSDSPVRAVAFSPDGTCLAASREEGSILLWEAATPRPDERQAIRQERVERWHRTEGGGEDRSRWFAQEWHLTQLLREQPKSVEFLAPRALARLEQGKKEGALADVRLALADPKSLETPASDTLARVLVETKAAADYRRFGERLAGALDREGVEAGQLSRGLAILTLAPEGLPPESLLRLADRLGKHEPLSGLRLHLIGMAHYRAGRYPEAAKYFRQSLAAKGAGPTKENHLALAMTEHRRGNKKEAHKALEAAFARKKGGLFPPPSYAGNPLLQYREKRLEAEAKELLADLR